MQHTSIPVGASSRRRIPLSSGWLAVAAAAAAALIAAPAARAVSENYPWDRKTGFAPDSEVGGSFVNLGQTGARAKLNELSLEVRYVFAGTPAEGKLRVGDVIVGAGGRPFQTPHKFGWGYKNCGGEGPLMDIAEAIERSEAGDGKLTLTVQRDGAKKDVTLSLQRIGAFGATYPFDCPRTDRMFEGICEYLVRQQKPDGSWRGDRVVTSAAGLVLLGSGNPKYADNVRRAAESQMTIQPYQRGLHNWRLTYGGIFLAEYYLATGDERAIAALERISRGLVRNLSANGGTQHLKVGDVDWGGYNELSVMTGQAMMAWGLIAQCGIDVDRERIATAHDFLASITCATGYVCYNRREFYDLHGNNIADFGRTGAAVMGHWLCDRRKYDAYIRKCAGYIGDYHKWFPDTHGSPGVGMMWSALAAAIANEPGFRRLMDYHKWWFTLAWCGDGSFVAQPTRSGGVGADYWALPREWMTAVVGLIFALKEHKLRICGGDFNVLGLDDAQLTDRTKAICRLLAGERFGEALAALGKLPTSEASRPAAKVLAEYTRRRVARAAGELEALGMAGDFYRLDAKLRRMAGQFAGAAAFDGVAGRVKQALAREPGKSLITVGREYYGIVDDLKHPLTLEPIHRLERLAEQHKAAGYAAMASQAIEELWEIGIELLPTAERKPQIWRYTTDKPDEDWAKVGFDDSKWAEGPAGFGRRPTVQGVVRTPWTSSDIWLRRAFALEVVPPLVRLPMYHDDTVEVYINGVLAYKAEKGVAVYSPRAISAEARAALKVGTNTLAVHCTNAAGSQYIDVGVTGLHAPVGAPPDDRRR